ncbi:MerR family transcriptional regulator [Duganella sp. Root1480D1]|uniref:MerR family transcriptional regulator n=1 Tax=Duganella sp. Root1480D1 TaxID=1736471 RepID=UPI0007107471|nr:MerR family transcriptional regulator [Duganella sp. Root1480D1]KQZ27519.1 MerR family transcriptional regulator [Duganella sp. Root1480D1]
MYTVKQLSDITGVTGRTLRYYDSIGLLKPSRVGDNGYRYYNEADLLRLQQVLFYREMDVPLAAIFDIMSQPGFDVLAALQSHKHALAGRLQELQGLISTVDRTILHLKGNQTMKAVQLFDGLRERQHKYEREAEQKYGKDVVQASARQWQGYSEGKQKDLIDEGNAIYSELAVAMGLGASSETVQILVARWHHHMQHFWPAEREHLPRLAATYRDDPRFRASFDNIHPDLAPFMVEAVSIYAA